MTPLKRLFNPTFFGAALAALAFLAGWSSALVAVPGDQGGLAMLTIICSPIVLALMLLVLVFGRPR